MFDLTMIMQLLAGVALFLYGMKLMSDGMEKAAGNKLRKILQVLTKNRLLGLFVGIGFTVIIQSSSATTVMVVSFVNAGLMSLAQATGVILGANIGTTITAQLIAFKLTALAPIFLFAGVIMIMFIKKSSINRIGVVMLGFGVLFFGMSVMSDALEPLKYNEQLQLLLVSFDSPIMAVLIGILVTSIIHSSSASVGILQVLALKLDIPLSMSAYIVLGCNIGTCVDAILAGLAGNKDAKRASLIHLFFNVFGSLLMFTLLQLLPITDWVVSYSKLMAPEGNAALEIANAHTVFKIIEVLVFFPLAPYLVKLVQWLIPGVDRQGEDMQMKFLTDAILTTPPAAVQTAVLESERMAHMAADNLTLAMAAFLKQDLAMVELVAKNEKVINYMNHTITDYLVQINQLDITPSDASLIGSLFHVVNDIERIGDHAENISEFATMRVEENIIFSAQSEIEIQTMLKEVQQLLGDSIDLMILQEEARLPAIKAMEENIDAMEGDYQQAHVVRLTEGTCSAKAGMLYGDILSNLERVADHATNIAFLMAEKKTLRQKALQYTNE